MTDNMIQDFIAQQADFAQFRAQSFVNNANNQKKPQRSLYNKLFSYYKDFVDGETTNRLISLTWLRWSGKTTLLFQLFTEIEWENQCDVLFFSVDHIKSTLSIQLSDVLNWYEKFKGISFSQLSRPLCIFIDEAQFDAQVLKTLYALISSTEKVFVFAAGTPALLKQCDSILSHIISETLHPLSSAEYLKITKQKYKIPGLGSSIRDAILFSDTSEDLYRALQLVAPEINTYYKWAVLGDYYRYLCYGSFPHLIDINEESMVYEQMQRTLDRILYKDLAYAKFHPDTVALIPSMLFALSHMESCNIKKMAEEFNFSRSKMSEILDALENSGLLRRIYAYWPYLGEVVSRRSSKYLFATPAFRILNYRMLSELLLDSNKKSKIMEDVVAMYFHKAFDRVGKWILAYDANVWWADMIVEVDESLIPIQIEWNTEWYKEVAQTMKKYPSKYGIIISENQLGHDKDAGIVKIPLRMFLLM
jgi:predicted AAA+ superfamily ATPase